MTRWSLLLPLALLLAAPAGARAHCDTLDGPVAAAARAALDSGGVAPVLAWVKPAGEAEIREAFQHALAVRKLGGEARTLADRFFLETLVRVHRAGEGEPFTGVKPAGLDLGPAIPAADRALAAGSPQKVEELLVEAVRKGVRARFAAVPGAKPPADVAAGRAWVDAYVPYMHYVEGVYAAASGGAHGAAPAAGHAAHAAPQPEHAAHAEPAAERAQADRKPAHAH